MIIELTPNPTVEFKIPGGYSVPGLCAACGKRAVRHFNAPGNVIVPTCADPSCEPAGAIEVATAPAETGAEA